MADQNMSEHLQQLYASARAALQPILPKRLRGAPIVPVVRLAGVIGFSTPLKPGLTLATVARLQDAPGAGGRAGDQFARRLGGAVAPDLSAHPPARGRERTSGDRLCRGR